MTIQFTILDDATPLIAEEREALRQTWIATPADINEPELADIDEAAAWAERHRNSDLLTEGFVVKLHKRMFEDVWSWAGKTRRTGRDLELDRRQIDLQVGQLGGDPFTWGGSTLCRINDVRAEYRAALRAADADDLIRLLIFARS